MPPPPPIDGPAAVSEPTGGLQFIPLGVGKSIVIDLPGDVKDVLVADPTIANAVIRSTRRAFLIGTKVGQTNILFFDAQGRQLAGFDIAVTRDLNGLRAALKRALPNRDIRVEGLGERSVVLSGTVATAAESQLAYDLAVRFVYTAPTKVSTYNSSFGASGGGAEATSTWKGGSGSDDNNSLVVNALTINSRDQVMLKVTVAEVQRDLVKQLGIDLTGTLGSNNALINFNTVNPFTAYGQALSDTAIASALGGTVTNPLTGGTTQRFNAIVRAMERAGVIRTLAEPNLSAISGENATFLAGGEFPIPGGLTCDQTGRNCQVSVQYKKFGISLTFTPVVLSEGRISLKVMTEVSDLSNDSSITLQPTIGGPIITVPSIRTRRADTTVEIPSGGALAMAGMLQEQTKQQINGLPGLLQLPVLGTLFRSRDYVNRQTELMIIVTPYVVRPVAPKDLSRPDDGFADISDPSTILLGRLNRIYGVTGSADPNRTYFGRYGFILD
ncbi:MAG: type II and III secretion system protein family protein [Xanthobacteraceae bacterium]